MKYILLCLFTIIITSCSGPDKPAKKKSELWLEYEGKSDMPYILLVAGDEEYRSEEALPMLASILSEKHGFNCRVVFSQDPQKPGIADPNYSFNIPGIEALNDADLMIIFTRFRALPDDQMQIIDNYLKAGKPVVGIRTATHAFHFKEEVKTAYRHYGNYHQSEDAWNGGFGRAVLGEKWINHHGSHGNQSTRGIIADGAKGHPVLNGIADGEIWGPTDVYGVRIPMQEQVDVLVMGKTVERAGEKDETDPLLGMRSSDNIDPAPVLRKDGDNEIEVNLNDPMMPVVWSKKYQLPGGNSGRSVTSTIGSSTDMLNEAVRRLFVNASYWLLDMEVPEKADVNLIGDYSPSRFAFHDDDYWDNKNVVIKEIK